jgi:glucose/arabinose dehydrogenase
MVSIWRPAGRRIWDATNHSAADWYSLIGTADTPSATHQGWKFIAFGPDGWFYVPVGAPCNICDPDARFANIRRMSKR